MIINKESFNDEDILSKIAVDEEKNYDKYIRAQSLEKLNDNEIIKEIASDPMGGWLSLPQKYDIGEFVRIKEATKKINEESGNNAEIALFFHIPMPEYQLAYDKAWDKKKHSWDPEYKRGLL